MLKNKILLIIGIILIGTLISCDTGGGGGGGGGGTNTGGNSGGGGGRGQGKLIISFQGGASGSVRSTVSLNQLNYQITLTGNGETKSLTANGGDTVQATVSVGYWTVSVAAFYQGGLYATGSNYVDVKAGQSNSVSISLSLVGTSGGGGTGGGGGTTPSGPTDFTVTFSANGTTYDTQTVTSGGNATQPPLDPTHQTAALTWAANFRGWYVSGDTSYAIFDFTTPITANITLVADWGYREGDPGPSGGKIFHRDEAGFTVLGTPTTIAYYLEAATANATSGDGSELLSWESTLGAPISGLSPDIGAGKRNTANIIAAPNNCPAATIVNMYGGGGWFMPSINELQKLYDNRSHAGMGSATGNFWSSSNNGGTTSAQVIDFSTGGSTNLPNNNTAYVRPIRAF